MTTEPATAPETVEREWIYVGKRLNGQGKLRDVWLDHEGNERWYDKFSAAGVGNHYTVTLEATGRSVYTKGPLGPRYVLHTRDAAEREQVREWEQEERLAMTRASLDREAKKAAQDTELDAALASIRTRYRGLIRSSDRAALLAVVIQRITG